MVLELATALGKGGCRQQPCCVVAVCVSCQVLADALVFLLQAEQENQELEAALEEARVLVTQLKEEKTQIQKW